MYVIDGIAYAGEPETTIKVCGVRALENYRLWLRFSDGSIKIYDVNKLLNYPAFEPLKDKEVFKTVYIDYETVNWCEGEIDIAPEELYKNGVTADKENIA